MEWLLALIWCTTWPAICYWLAKQKNRNPVLWAILGLFFHVIAVLVLLFGIGKPTGEMISSEKFDSGHNPNYQSKSPTQLHYYWGNSKDGFAIDLHEQAVYISKDGRGRWFNIDEIKRYGLNEKSLGAEFYIVTSDINFPEFVWTVYNRSFLNVYRKFERTLASIGNFN